MIFVLMISMSNAMIIRPLTCMYSFWVHPCLYWPICCVLTLV